MDVFRVPWMDSVLEMDVPYQIRTPNQPRYAYRSEANEPSAVGGTVVFPIFFVSGEPQNFFRVKNRSQSRH